MPLKMQSRKSERSLGYQEGLKSGRRWGGEDGYARGRRQALLDRIPEPSLLRFPVKVLFVAQQTPGFYPIERGIDRALGELTQAHRTIGPNEDVVAWARELQPDVLLVLNGIFSITAEQVDQIKELGIRTAVWIADDPYFVDVLQELVLHYDYVFTHELNCVLLYQELGCREVHYLPFASDRRLVQPQYVPMDQRYDICFIGSAFPNRLDWFNQISRYLKNRRVFIAGGGWQQLNDYESLKRNIRLEGVIFPASIRYYCGASIVVNLHRAVHEAYNSRGIQGLSINPRTYEIAGAGSFQLTDVRYDLANYYRPGEEIATYTTPEELAEKLEYYLTHPVEREEIALKGLARTLRDHHYQNRMLRLLSAIYPDMSS